MTLQLYLQFWAKIFKFWWPVFFSAAVGLAYLYFDERRDKRGPRKKNRRPRKKSSCSRGASSRTA